jgi:hypothetical protein
MNWEALKVLTLHAVKSISVAKRKMLELFAAEVFLRR